VLSALVVTPFALAGGAGWAVTAFIASEVVIENIWSIGPIAVTLILIALCCVVTYQVSKAVRGLASAREVICLEK
jgi:hypothetical protein